MRNTLALFASIALLVSCTREPGPPQQPIQSWAAYYNHVLPAQAFRELDLVVFDRHQHPDLKPLKGKTITLAYVSMGEVPHDVPERPRLEREDAILDKNNNWNTHIVDLTSPTWQRMVMIYVDLAMGAGFDGIMLDTLDSPLEWAKNKSPEADMAMQEAALQLIRDIRLKHPTIKIMLNRGFTIINKVAPDVNYILAESILTRRDDSTGQYGFFPASTYAELASQLNTLRKQKPTISVLTLDYWNINDAHGMKKVYTKQRESGFTAYVTTPDLRQFTPEHAAKNAFVAGL